MYNITFKERGTYVVLVCGGSTAKQKVRNYCVKRSLTCPNVECLQDVRVVRAHANKTRILMEFMAEISCRKKAEVLSQAD